MTKNFSKHLMIWGNIFILALILSSCASKASPVENPAEFEDPILGFEDPILGFEDPLWFDDPILGIGDPAETGIPIIIVNDPSEILLPLVGLIVDENFDDPILGILPPDSFEDPFWFDDPILGFEDPLWFDDPILGYENPTLAVGTPLLGLINLDKFEDPILGFEDPILGFSDPSQFTLPLVGLVRVTDFEDPILGILSPDLFEDPILGLVSPDAFDVLLISTTDSNPPRLAFEDPILGFENPIIAFEDPILGFEDPILGVEDPTGALISLEYIDSTALADGSALVKFSTQEQTELPNGTYTAVIDAGEEKFDYECGLNSADPTKIYCYGPLITETLVVATFTFTPPEGDPVLLNITPVEWLAPKLIIPVSNPGNNTNNDKDGGNGSGGSCTTVGNFCDAGTGPFSGLVDQNCVCVPNN